MPSVRQGNLPVSKHLPGDIMLWIVGCSIATVCNGYATWWLWRSAHGLYWEGHGDGYQQGVNVGVLLTVDELKKFNERKTENQQQGIKNVLDHISS